MSILSQQSRGRQEGGKAALPKWLFLPKGRSCWDIAKNVMYCHGCGALSEFQHIFMFLMPCALRRCSLAAEKAFFRRGCSSWLLQILHPHAQRAAVSAFNCTAATLPRRRSDVAGKLRAYRIYRNFLSYVDTNRCVCRAAHQPCPSEQRG